MELRPMQTALLAGRAASRWATSTSTTASKPSLSLSIYSSPFYRSFSSTRPALQEAEATAPLPGGSMASYFSKQRAQQQQQQRQEQQGQQPQTQQSSSPSPQATKNSIFPDSPSDLKTPWATRPSNAQVVPTRARARTNEVIGDLGLNDYLNPQLSDIEKSQKTPIYERPIDVKYRLRPVVGRTVELSTGNDNAARNLDFAKALARLDMNMRVNRVAQDVRRQRFHERNGLKKKRLRSERWRRRFMDGFRATCKRVSELAGQGW